MKKVEKLKKLEYYVLEEDFNSSKVKFHNIFAHSYIQDRLPVLLKDFVTYEDFKEQLTNLLKYCYLSKREYEIFIEVRGKFSKISIYDQIEPNIDLIANYIIDTYNN